MNRRIMMSIVASGLFFSLQGMEEDRYAEEAKRHVEILFSCYPVFDIAMTESDEAFTGHLDEIHATLVSRTELYSVQDNDAFISKLRESVEKQKKDTLAKMRECGYQEADLSKFLVRIMKLENLVSVFATSCDIQKSGGWDTQLPILDGLNPAYLNPHRRETVQHGETSLARVVRTFVIGVLVVGLPAYVFGLRK